MNLTHRAVEERRAVGASPRSSCPPGAPAPAAARSPLHAASLLPLHQTLTSQHHHPPFLPIVHPVGSGIFRGSGQIRHHFAGSCRLRHNFAASGQIRHNFNGSERITRSVLASRASRSGDLGSETGYNTVADPNFFDKNICIIFSNCSLNWPNSLFITHVPILYETL